MSRALGLLIRPSVPANFEAIASGARSLLFDRAAGTAKVSPERERRIFRSPAQEIAEPDLRAKRFTVSHEARVFDFRRLDFARGFSNLRKV